MKFLFAASSVFVLIVSALICVHFFRSCFSPDAKNCTFRPSTNESRRKKQVAARKKQEAAASGNNSSDDDEAKGARDQNFLLRQEANERKRQQEMAFQKGKQQYDALVDKKLCPVCTATQSYDEVKEKRKNCPNCQVPYTFKTNWGSVQRGFYKRQNDAYVGGVRALDELRREVEEEVRGQREGEVVWTRDIEEEFFGRMAESAERRQARVRQVESEVYGEMEADRKRGGRRGAAAGVEGGGGGSRGEVIDTSQYYF